VSRVRVVALAVGGLVALGCLGALTITVLQSQERAERDILARFSDRASLSAQLLAAEQGRAATRQGADAQIRLSGEATEEALAAWEGEADPAIPYTALFDGEGRLLAAHPSDSRPAQTALGAEALEGATQGMAGTSGVIELSEAQVVETYVPFPAGDAGLRVLVIAIPLDFFQQLQSGALEGAAGTPSGSAYVTDREGTLIVAVGQSAARDSDAEEVIELVRAGRTEGPLGDRWLVSRPVPNTGLVLTLTAPQDELTADLPPTLPPRLTLAAFALTLLVAAGLAARTVRDARRLEAAHRAAEEARRVADDANLAKSEFLARMSHELRTPLNAILGFGELLTLDDLTPDQREYTDQILKGGRRLLDLINEVLDISRIETRTQQLSLEPVLVEEVVGDAVDLIRPLADERSIRLRSQIPSEVAVRYVLADKQRLGQVVLNLLSNAVKYNVERGTVSVTAAARGRRIRIGVTDTGPGIPEEKVPLLFAPYERLGAEQTNVEGTGLGLALSKTIVEAMGGTVAVDTMMGEGTTFWVDLPETDAPSAAEALSVRGPVGEVAPSGGTILYVEDNLSNLKLVERILANHTDLAMISAMTGALGIDLARQHTPDLILLDLNLPDVPGDQVLARLRRDPRTRDIPVVILSADATPGQVDRLLAAGAHEFLAKPIAAAEFLGSLDRMLRLPAREAEGSRPLIR
jgi:signal transduction histidine kinase/CheY-like chemotaxis protein